MNRNQKAAKKKHRREAVARAARTRPAPRPLPGGPRPSWRYAEAGPEPGAAVQFGPDDGEPFAPGEVRPLDMMGQLLDECPECGTKGREELHGEEAAAVLASYAAEGGGADGAVVVRCEECGAVGIIEPAVFEPA